MPPQRAMTGCVCPKASEAVVRMESESLYEVERIADERQDLSGKRAYLVQWKGYGRDSDSWEPEENLVACEEVLKEFRLQKAEEPSDGAPASPREPRSPAAQHPVGPRQVCPGESVVITTSQGTRRTGLLAGSPKLSHSRVKADLKTSVPRSLVAEERDLDGLKQTLPKIQVQTPNLKVLVPTRCVPVPDLSERASDSPMATHWPEGCELESDANTVVGVRPCLQKSALATPVRNTGKVTRSKRRPAVKSREQAFGTVTRFSRRQAEGRYTFKDIVVRKHEGFTHIILSSKSSQNNCLNPGVMKEVQRALSSASKDDSRFVLFSALGNAFCCGLDLVYLSRRLGEDQRSESRSMSECLQSFVNHFIQFRKPIVAAVDGPAMGLGASIVALCDLVWSSDKAWFQTPYMTQGQTPDGCSSLTFPKIMGGAAASEMLLSGQKLTAQEACDKGLVSQVFWPSTFKQEVMARVSELALCHPLALIEGKTMLRCNAKADLEQANTRECEVLKRIWGSAQGVHSMLKYLERKDL